MSLSSLKLDHIGLLPSLVNNHMNIPIITNHENRILMRPLFLDSAYIMSKNTKTLTNKKYKVEPLYTEADVYLTMNNVIEKSVGEIHKLNNRVSYQFVNAGHILGSCQLILYIKSLSGNIKKIHVSSDLGSEYNKTPFVPSKDIVSNSNVSIFEGNTTVA